MYLPSFLPGPLLYHFENMANELSIELSYEDMKAAILKYGFELEVNTYFESNQREGPVNIIWTLKLNFVTFKILKNEPKGSIVLFYLFLGFYAFILIGQWERKREWQEMSERETGNDLEIP